MDKKAAMSEHTKQNLKNTFLELYANGGMTHVTVGAIAKKAGYNRSTFYNYYDDLQSMLDEIEDTIIEQVHLKMQEIFSDGISLDIRSVFPLILSVFEEYGNTLYVLLGRNGVAAFRQKLRKAVKEHFREVFKNRIGAEELDFVLTYTVSAGIGLIEHWYETDKKYAAQDFLKLAHSLLATGLLGRLNNPINKSL